MQLRDLFDEFPVGQGEVVPLVLQQLLKASLDVQEDWQRAEQLLRDTRALLPERLEIPVALYKMYAYSNRFDESLELINEVLSRAAAQEGFVADWQLLDSHSASWGEARGAVRFYLYSMKAMGFVLLRKGEVEQAHAVLQKLCELDPRDQVGGSVVFDIAERLLERDEEEVA
jgi:tetratricopeptide (TPR) repeat protein